MLIFTPLPFKYWRLPSFLSIRFIISTPIFIISTLGFLLLGDSETLLGIFYKPVSSYFILVKYKLQ